MKSLTCLNRCGNDENTEIRELVWSVDFKKTLERRKDARNKRAADRAEQLQQQQVLAPPKAAENKVEIQEVGEADG